MYPDDAFCAFPNMRSNISDRACDLKKQRERGKGLGAWPGTGDGSIAGSGGLIGSSGLKPRQPIEDVTRAVSGVNWDP